MFFSMSALGIVFSDYCPDSWIIFLNIHDSVEQYFLHVPIIGFRKFVSIHLFVNGTFRYDSMEGQVMG